jgi:hypothetical protein
MTSKSIYQLVCYQRARLLACRALSCASLGKRSSAIDFFPSPAVTSRQAITGNLCSVKILPRSIHSCRVVRHDDHDHKHEHEHEHEHDIKTAVRITKTKNLIDGKPIAKIAVNENNSVVNDDDEDMEEMFVQGPAGLEWGGPTRGGRRPEVSDPDHRYSHFLHLTNHDIADKIWRLGAQRSCDRLLSLEKANLIM